MITLLLLIPIIGSILLIPINENEEEPTQTNSLTLVYKTGDSKPNSLAQANEKDLLKEGVVSAKSAETGIKTIINEGQLKITSNQLKMKQIALTTCLINLFISLFM